MSSPRYQPPWPAASARHLRAVLLLTLLAMLFSTFATSTRMGFTQPEGSWEMHRTDDGRLLFAYPAGWHVEDHWPDAGLYLTNFRLGERCCEMLDGDIKIDFVIEPARTASIDELLADRCREDAFSRPLSCRTESIGDRAWAWIVGTDPSHGLVTTVMAATVDGGDEISTIAIVPEGPLARAGRDEAERILRTVRLG